MARAGRLTITGDDTLFKALDKLEARFRRETLEGMLEEAAEPIRTAAEALAPRRTGLLARSMETERRKARGRTEALVVVGPHRNAFYGTFQEFGLGPGPKQPFLRPAFDTKKDDARGVAAVEMRKIIARTV